MATSPSHAPVSPVREFQHERSDFKLSNANQRFGIEGGVDTPSSRLCDRIIPDISNNDGSDGRSSQPDGQSSRNSPLAGGSTTCRSRNKSESSRVCSPANEPWKQQQSHFRPWLAPSKSSNAESTTRDASSKRYKPYDLISSKQRDQEVENAE